MHVLAQHVLSRQTNASRATLAVDSSDLNSASTTHCQAGVESPGKAVAALSTRDLKGRYRYDNTNNGC